MDARLTYDELVRAWKALRSRGVAVREVACVGAPRTLLCAEFGPNGAPAVTLAAGIHGDEPAGPWALLELVRDGELDPAYAYRIWPCTNPSGYAAGTRANEQGADVNRSFERGGSTPEARAIVTASRDRRFVLSLDLHEDMDADGFYCYEYGTQEIGHAVIAALDARGFAVARLGSDFDLGVPFAPAHVRFERGRVLPDTQAESLRRAAWSYTLFMRHRARWALTFETPARRPWETRLGMHRTAVTAAIGAISQASRKSNG